MKRFNQDFWQNKTVIVTGHTGFKGSWLCLLLEHLNAKIFGYSLSNTDPRSAYMKMEIASFVNEKISDIRNFDEVDSFVREIKPDIIIHMAAQPLVLESYLNPHETYTTNLLGTLNLLEAVRKLENKIAIVNVTTDKVYENSEWAWGYREIDPLGGIDPYACSKACSDNITLSYQKSFFKKTNIAAATARAGNVIGGGDSAANRILPDLLRAVECGSAMTVRNPQSIRPWQHVLDPLVGYLTLAEYIYTTTSDHEMNCWNFGPEKSSEITVREVCELTYRQFGIEPRMKYDAGTTEHEAGFLRLDSSRANQILGWFPRWDIGDAIKSIVAWYRHDAEGSDMKEISLFQIEEYLSSGPSN